MRKTAKLFTRSTGPERTTVQFRVDVAVKELLVQKASDAGMDLTEYLIKAGLNRPIRSNVAATVINQLSQFAMQQKELATQTDRDHDLYRDLMREIIGCIDAIWNKRVKL